MTVTYKKQEIGMSKANEIGTGDVKPNEAVEQETNDVSSFMVIEWTLHAYQ